VKPGASEGMVLQIKEDEKTEGGLAREREMRRSKREGKNERNPSEKETEKWGTVNRKGGVLLKHYTQGGKTWEGRERRKERIKRREDQSVGLGDSTKSTTK